MHVHVNVEKSFASSQKMIGFGAKTSQKRPERYYVGSNASRMCEKKSHVEHHIDQKHTSHCIRTLLLFTKTHHE